MSTRKAATSNGFLIFTDQLYILENIPDENVGKAIKLLLQNFDTMQPISVEPFTNMAYELIATNIRRYRTESEHASQYGKKGGGNPTLNPTFIGTYKGTYIPTYKQQDKTIQDNTIQDNLSIYMYGEYKNVYLPDNKACEFEALCLNKKLANEIIEYLSQQIEQGKDEDYNSKKPNAHFARLKQLLQYRRKHADRFLNSVDTTSTEWIKELEKKYGEG